MIINCTSHEIGVYDNIGLLIGTFPKSSLPIPRVIEEDSEGPFILCFGREVPTTRKTYSNVENMPEEMQGVTYIVSKMVLDACKDRTDLIAPDTGSGAVRNEKGQIVGTKQFVY